MSIFWENLNKLCKDRGIYPNTVAAALGLSVATASKWKNGSQPRDVTLQKIAEYFGVSVSELIEEKKPAENGGRAEEFMRLYEALSPELQEAFLLQLRGLSNKK